MTPTDRKAIRLFSRTKGEIKTMEDWRVKRDAVNSGWVPGKSAFETANAWVGNGKPLVPLDIQSLLESHEYTKELLLLRGEVEKKTHLHHRPPYGPRNHDIALWTTDEDGFVGIESKADDGFDGTMGGALKAAKEDLSAGKRTGLHLRVDWLSYCLLGHRLIVNEEESCADKALRDDILALPYQLFAGVAGTLFEAKACRAKLAVFVVHQFCTHLTNEEDIRRDSEALDRFVSRLLLDNPTKSIPHNGAAPLAWGRLVGPIVIQERLCGDDRWDVSTDIQLFIGKALTNRTVCNAPESRQSVSDGEPNVNQYLTRL
jgi:hypothetical protein